MPDQRLHFLDGGRGLAVLYVVIFHTVYVPHPDLAHPDWLTAFLRFGGTGVILFFVISGFSLCLTMPRHLSHPAPMMSYTLARIFRIAPLFYTLLLLTLARDYFFRGIERSWLEAAASVVFVYNFNPEWAKGIVWASWTIGVEMIFYAIFPLLYFTARSPVRKILIIIAFAGMTYIVRYYYIPPLRSELQGSYASMNIVRNIPIFIVGMVTFDAFRARDWRKHQEIGWILLVSSLTILAISALTPSLKNPYLDKAQIHAIAYGAFLLGLAAVPIYALVNPATRFLSKISYSMYLWHPFIIFAISPVYVGIYSLNISNGAALAITVATTLAIVTVVSYLSFIWIELPGQRLGSRILAKYSARQRPPELIPQH